MADPENIFNPTSLDEIMAGQTGVAIRKFMDELESIRRSLDAITKLRPQDIVNATRTHAESYSTGSASVSASRATSDTPSGSAPGAFKSLSNGLIVPQSMPHVQPPQQHQLPFTQQPRPGYGPSRPPTPTQGQLPLQNPQGQLFPPEGQPGSIPQGTPNQYPNPIGPQRLPFTQMPFSPAQGASRPPTQGQLPLQSPQGQIFPPEQYPGQIRPGTPNQYPYPIGPEPFAVTPNQFPSGQGAVNKQSRLSSLGQWGRQTAPAAGFIAASSGGGLGQRFINFSRGYQASSPIHPHGTLGVTNSDSAEYDARGEDEIDDAGASRPPSGGGRGGGGRRTATGGGDTPEGGGPSRPDLPDGDWRKSIDENILDRPLTIPRSEGGRFTSQDLFTFLGDISARSATKADAASPDGSAGDLRGTAAMWSYRAANRYAPTYALSRQYGSGIVQRLGMNDITNVGYNQGFSGQGSDIAPFGIGLQLPGPLNSAGLEGAKIQASELRQSAKAGVNRGQVNQIYNNLSDRGWYFGDQNFGRMRDSLTSLTQWNPAIGTNPLTADMQDRTVRMGSSSLNDFNAVMRQIPDSARAAHVSLAQMQSDMDQMGEVNQTRGGTYASGMRDAAQFSAATGMPANVQTSLLNNPYISMQAMTRYGILPSQAGLLSPEQQTNATLSGVMQMYHSFGAGSFTDRTSTDALGLRSTISARSQRIAMVANQLGISPESVTRMVNQNTQMQAGNTASLEMRDLSTTIGGISRNKGLTDAEKNRQITALYNPRGGTMRGLMSQMNTMGLSHDQINSVMNAGKDDGSPAAKASAQYNAFRKVLAERDKDLTDVNQSDQGAVTIGLTAQAQRFIKVVSSTGSAKAKAAAGQSTTNSANGSGQTQIDPRRP